MNDANYLNMNFVRTYLRQIAGIDANDWEVLDSETASRTGDKLSTWEAKTKSMLGEKYMEMTYLEKFAGIDSNYNSKLSTDKRVEEINKLLNAVVNGVENENDGQEDKDRIIKIRDKEDYKIIKIDTYLENNGKDILKYTVEDYPKMDTDTMNTIGSKNKWIYK